LSKFLAANALSSSQDSEVALAPEVLLHLITDINDIMTRLNNTEFDKIINSSSVSEYIFYL
jgi:hypothetical protein